MQAPRPASSLGGPAPRTLRTPAHAPQAMGGVSMGTTRRSRNARSWIYPTDLRRPRSDPARQAEGEAK
jgi:hypothetical protein